MAKNHGSSIKVLDVCIVAPPSCSALPASLPLTFFDILWFRFPPVERLFFYKSSAPFDVILLNLKNSLSLVLQHYLPLAGALVWPETSPKPTVVTTVGDGVVLTVADSGDDFDHLVSDGLHEVVKFRPLVAQLAVAEERAAVIAVQITSFGKGGFSIGITSHHAILDGRSLTSFVKSWAALCKNMVGAGEPVSPVDETMPFYDRSVVIDPAGLEDIYLRFWSAMGGPNNRSLKFWDLAIPPDLFRAHSLPHVSTFTVAMAYTWVCASVANNSPPDDKMIFGLAVDARRRLDPPLPTMYFGNCVVGRVTALEKAKLAVEQNGGVVTAVEAISDMIKSLEAEGPLKGAEDWVSLLTNVVNESWKMMSTAGSPRFAVYNVDFGWGTPEKVEVVSIDATGAVCISESRDGGDGVELVWTAKKNVFENFAATFAIGLEQL